MCGDSKNMGLVECDDGNLISGDGCSSTCQIEDNYICKGGNESNPDICKETIPPIINSFIQLEDPTLFQISFSEPVLFAGNLL